MINDIPKKSYFETIRLYKDTPIYKASAPAMTFEESLESLGHHTEWLNHQVDHS